MQVDPNTVAQAAITVTAPAGGSSALEPGKAIVARVLEVSDSSGGARISIAGYALSVQTTQPLTPGQVLNLTVGAVSDGKLTLTINDPASAAPSAAVAAVAQAEVELLTNAGSSSQTTGGSSSGSFASLAPRAVSELARAGVAVTPELVQAVAKAVERITSAETSNASNAGSTTRAVAELAARGLTLNEAAATRVAAALDLSGKLGTSLTALAAKSPEIAAALPAGSPNSTALRSLLASSLTPVELAVARVAQAVEAAKSVEQSAPGGPITLSTPRSASPNVIANYVASQVAVTNQLDEIAHASTTQPATSPVSTTPLPAASDPSAGAKAQAAAVRGMAPGGISTPSGLATAAPLDPAAEAANATSAAKAATAATTQVAQRGGAAAAATAAATPATTPAVANAVAELSISVARFAPAIASATGPMADVAAAEARSLAGVVTSAGDKAPAVASSSFSNASSLIAAMREALTNPSADLKQLTTMMSQATREDISAALRQLPEAQTLQLAGRMLSQLSANPAGAQSEMLKHALNNALTDLGHALQPPGVNDASNLAAALRHVAATDARPSVADMAGRLMQAADGQLILSQPRAGMDPGYVYFQMPMPNQRSAEVIVRREPGRRAISSDQFNIAFLLDTESMGTLMIQLDGAPASVRAMIKTDIPSLEPFLATQADSLRSAIESEAGRPIVISTGVFNEGTAPTSLLSPELGLIEPGMHAYYA